MTTPDHQSVDGEDYCRCGKILPCDDADRQTRRDTAAVVLGRLDRGKTPTLGEIGVLRNCLTAEQADADQAREQLAEAKARPAGGTVTASDVLVQHDVTRKALCDALDAGYHLNWQQLVDTAQRHHDANAEWQADVAAARQGEAEAVRAREAAEQRARDLSAALSDAEAALVRTGAEVKHLSAKLTAAQAENDGWAETVRNTDRLTTAEATELRTRAERAEATLTAVRAIKKAPGRSPDNRYANAQDDGWDQAIDAVRAALGDPQPATEPRLLDCGICYEENGEEVHPHPECTATGPKPREVCCVCGCPDVTYHNYREQPFCCRCAMCCDPPQLCAHECKPPMDSSEAPECADARGCDKVVPCIPGCAVNARALGAAMAAEREQPAGPLLHGPVPAIHVHLDNRGAVYHPWPQEWRAQPTEGGKSEYRRNVEREAEQRVTIYGISVNEWDRLWLTVQRIADAAGVKPE